MLNEKMQAGGKSEKEISVGSWRKFARLINKNIRKNDLFRPGYNQSENLFESVEKLKNQVYVIDISNLNESIQALYSSRSGGSK